MKTGYRVEEMGGIGGWCLIRNHDDEIMAIYSSHEAATGALAATL